MSGLSPSYIYTLTGPSPNDMSVIGEAPLGLGIVGLTMQLSSTTSSGARTLFIQNASLDLAAATGVMYMMSNELGRGATISRKKEMR